MGRVCINDHRPEHSMGGDGWANGCAQCELDKLRADLAIAEQEAALWEERARHLDRSLSMDDGNITVEVSTQAAQAELERLRADNAALRREAHSWWTAARDALKLREPLAPEVIEAAAAEAFGYEGGLQEVNLGDLLHFARVLEQRHGIGA